MKDDPFTIVDEDGEVLGVFPERSRRRSRDITYPKSGKQADGSRSPDPDWTAGYGIRFKARSRLRVNFNHVGRAVMRGPDQPRVAR